LENLSKSILNGTFWVSGGQLLTLIISLGTSMILTRHLSSDEFGQFAIVLFFISIANVLAESGLAGALVRKKNPTKEDYSTVFLFNFGVSIILFFIFYFLSGFVGEYYRDPKIGKILSITSIVLVTNSLHIVYHARLMNSLQFKRKSNYRFFSILLGSLIGIFAAFLGAGVWSLVIIQISISLILLSFFFIFEGRFPISQFSKTSINELWGFGVNTTLVSIINTAFDNLYSLIFAKYFSISQVGYFYQAKKLQDVPGGLVNIFSQSVLFSSLSKLQDSRMKFYELFNRINILLMIFLGFASVMLFVFAEEIIVVLFGDDWIKSSYYMRFLAVASTFFYSEMVNKVIFKVFNQTKKLLYLEIVKKCLLLVLIIYGVYISSIPFLMYSLIVSNFFSYTINYIVSRRILDIKGLGQLLPIIKIYLLCFVFGFFLYKIKMMLPYSIWVFFGLIVAFTLIYSILIEKLKIIQLFKEIRILYNTIILRNYNIKE